MKLNTSRSVVFFFASLAVMSCGGSFRVARPAILDAAQCSMSRDHSAPLIVDWSNASRGELELLASKHTVAVHYAGCKISVLRQCRVRGTYTYRAITPKHDQIVMRDRDELYANIPFGAASFEAKLLSAGALSVQSTIVGRFDATNVELGSSDFEGDCASATHVITGLSAGSFRFFAGSGEQGGGDVGAFGVGAGGSTASRREVLVEDGNDGVCARATAADAAPPYGCGALIRVELVPIGTPTKSEPSCPPPTQWDGKQCVRVAPSEPVAEDSPPGRVPSAARAPGGSCAPGMAWIPGGLPFTVPSDSGTHVVTKPYCLDTHEVTAGAYAACTSAGKCSAEGLTCDVTATYGAYGQEQHPINCVNYEQAKAYCAWRDKRLPTIEEWAWAVRGGDEARKNPWGNAPPKDQLCWSGRKQESWDQEVVRPLGTCAVGQFPKDVNRWGVFDLSGNVSEWARVAESHPYGKVNGLNWRSMTIHHGSTVADGFSSQANKGHVAPEMGFRCAR